MVRTRATIAGGRGEVVVETPIRDGGRYWCFLKIGQQKELIEYFTMD